MGPNEKGSAICGFVTKWKAEFCNELIMKVYILRKTTVRFQISFSGSLTVPLGSVCTHAFKMK